MPIYTTFFGAVFTKSGLFYFVAGIFVKYFTVFDNNYGYGTFLGLSFGMEVDVVMMNNHVNVYYILWARFGIKGTNVNKSGQFT